MLCCWDLLWAEEQDNHGHFWLPKAGWQVGWPDCIASISRAASEGSMHCWECYLGGVAQAGCSDSKPLNEERPCWYDLSAQHPSPVLYIVSFSEASEVFLKFFFLCFPDYTLEFSRQQWTCLKLVVAWMERESWGFLGGFWSCIFVGFFTRLLY